MKFLNNHSEESKPSMLDVADAELPGLEPHGRMTRILLGCDLALHHELNCSSSCHVRLLLFALDGTPGSWEKADFSLQFWRSPEITSNYAVNLEDLCASNTVCSSILGYKMRN